MTEFIPIPFRKGLADPRRSHRDITDALLLFLETLRSRNMVHGDLHEENIGWRGWQLVAWDWEDSVLFHPSRTPPHRFDYDYLHLAASLLLGPVGATELEDDRRLLVADILVSRTEHRGTLDELLVARESAFQQLAGARGQGVHAPPVEPSTRPLALRIQIP